MTVYFRLTALDEEEIDRREHMVKNAAFILLLAGQTSQLEHFHES